MKAAEQYSWSKSELIAKIADNAHEDIVLEIIAEMCYDEKKKADPDSRENAGVVRTENRFRDRLISFRTRRELKEIDFRRWTTMLYLISMEKRPAFVGLYLAGRYST